MFKRIFSNNIWQQCTWISSTWIGFTISNFKISFSGTLGKSSEKSSTWSVHSIFLTWTREPHYSGLKSKKEFNFLKENLTTFRQINIFFWKKSLDRNLSLVHAGNFITLIWNKEFYDMHLFFGISYFQHTFLF